MGIGTRILLGMGVGAALGGVLGDRVAPLQPIGDVFIRLLMMVAVPLVAFNLLAGLTTLTDVRAFGRVTGKLFGYFAATTAVAVLLGLAATLILTPGVGMTAYAGAARDVGPTPTVTGVLVGLIPAQLNKVSTTSTLRATAEGLGFT